MDSGTIYRRRIAIALSERQRRYRAVAWAATLERKPDEAQHQTKTTIEAVKSLQHGNI
jgi:hypothetical protein